ncbi:HNH endonuclease family protein [Streptomyces ovatisporus]|uniref:HNH endonuclease family protein n=1 Tax=Streptomyces ovatisporus TaxID=1128682 RepID=A0ABV9A5L2_9ACTN
MKNRALPTIVVAVSVLAGCSGVETGADDVKSRPTTSVSASAADRGEQLEELKVAPSGSMDGYDRDKYPHWSGQGNSCDTREAVLKRDGERVETGSDCSPTSGTWTSPYDGEKWTDPSDVDIDHMVPLANSWISGADEWSDEEREEFANDLESKQLLAVTDNVNQQKSDQSPDRWKPPLESYHCQYSTDWIQVKHLYELTITAAEKAALKDMIGTC